MLFKRKIFVSLLMALFILSSLSAEKAKACCSDNIAIWIANNIECFEPGNRIVYDICYQKSGDDQACDVSISAYLPESLTIIYDPSIWTEENGALVLSVGYINDNDVHCEQLEIEVPQDFDGTEINVSVVLSCNQGQCPKTAELITPVCSVPPEEQPGTGTPGYWKNHPDAWPVEEITIGDITYDKYTAIGLMQTPVKGDKTLTLFKALVSAKLNVEIGNHFDCIEDSIYAADTWMYSHPVGSGVKANSPAWKQGEPLYEKLDDYNNGNLCAPHRD